MEDSKDIVPPVTVCDGKYTFRCPSGDWRIYIDRYNEGPWVAIEAGHRAVLALMQSHHELAERLRVATELLEAAERNRGKDTSKETPKTAPLCMPVAEGQVRRDEHGKNWRVVERVKPGFGWPRGGWGVESCDAHKRTMKVEADIIAYWPCVTP